MIGPAPTPEALAQYVEALGLGLDPATARSEIFPDHQPRVILSLVDQEHPMGPIVIGWDVCGKCSRFVTVCICKNGPTPPGYVQTWRPKDFEKASAPVEAALEPGQAQAEGAMG